MKPKYQYWIRKNVDTTYGKCASVTEAMCAAFPELTRVRGHYYCVAWGEREHWWCKDQDGNIVDPTAGQFPSKGRGVYVEWEEGAKEPTGMCPNCGEYCYDGNYFCCENCEIAYVAYVMSPL
ncbi:MAG: hypothetical protein KKF08_18910 [Gammaproteobacteria bacterium]|nr:hypothetical protein [Gammaproteobacteria bacterium]